jgi:outer membrane protein assembly factor BamB
MRSGTVRVAAAAVAMVTVGAMVTGSPAAAQNVPGTPAWPQFQGNAAHTGYEPGETSVTRQNVGQLTVAWTQALPDGGSDNSEVAVSGGTVYISAGDTVTAFGAASGTQLWQATLPGGVLGTPSVSGGLVVVAYDWGSRSHPKGSVVALNGATGTTMWSKQVGHMVSLSLASDTTVTTTASRAYVALFTGQIAALSLSTGHLRWRSPVLPGFSVGGLCVLSQPSAYGRFVVVGTGGEVVTALNTGNGTVAWSDTLSSGGCGENAENWTPAISGGTVYAGWNDGIAAISLDSGSVTWDNQTLGGTYFPLSVNGYEVMGAQRPGGSRLVLTALKRSDGSVRWSSAKGSEASAATFGGLGWSMSGRKAVAFNVANGHRVYTSPSFPDDTQGFPPVVDAGYVYINTGAELMALALPS